jgi:hypothetical protein
MIKKYLNTAWYSIIEMKASSVVYVLGLIVSMVICMLIGLWIHNKIACIESVSQVKILTAQL